LAVGRPSAHRPAAGRPGDGHVAARPRPLPFDQHTSANWRQVDRTSRAPGHLKVHR
jgi:hypothetical protein